MKKLFFVLATLGAQTAVFAQTPSPTPSPNDVEALRQQVQALTETVRALQQQVKDQQETLAKMNGNPATVAASEAPAATPAPPASAAPIFPTTDESVVATTAQPTPIPGATTGAIAPAPAGQFPTTDASVTTASETISTSGAGASLTAPMTIMGGGKTYMNMSFDGQFSLAYSSDRNLDQFETGDHDPQQRGFNARNLELALDKSRKLSCRRPICPGGCS